jgi:carboxyl-terminal processing protease
MVPRRSWSITLLIAFVGTANTSGQQGEDDLSVADRAYVASKIYSSVELYFAHRAGLPGFNLEGAYKAYLGKALAAKGRHDFDLATLEFIAQLRNKHTQFNDQWLYRKHGQSLGFAVSVVEGKWVITSTHDNRLKTGAVIRTIDGAPIAAFVRQKQAYVAASSERAAQSAVFDRPYLFPQSFVLGFEDGSKVTIERKSAEKMSEARPLVSEGRWLLEGSLAYLKIPSWNDPNYEKSALEFVKRHRDAKCLIIDVRGNGGGSTPFQLIRELMDRDWRLWLTSTPSHVALRRAQGTPNALLQIDSYRNSPQPGAFAGRLILLVDRFTCSASEDFVMTFKDNGRAQIIGETTEGSSGQPYFFQFGNGMSLMVGSARYSFPDGSPFESRGIEPTIPVDWRIADVRSGVDPVLEKAKKLAAAP